jgi:hypothetical protein
MQIRNAIWGRNPVFILAALALLVSCGAAPGPAVEKSVKARHRVAAVKSKYDDVDLVLKNYRIPHDILAYRDLENPDLLSAYRSVFVPSGIDNPMEESLDVYANNFRFKSVALKPDFYEVDKEKVARNLRRFVRNGGAAYFSGYSFEYLQRAFDIFEFFDNFPYMGMPARLETTLFGDLFRYALKKKVALYLDHPGWIAVKSVRDAEIMAMASFDTPRGVRSGPITVLARRGGGEILYTSYDSTMFSDFRRFNIYRIAGAHLLEKLEDEASRWGQTVTGRIVSSIHNDEYADLHRIDLARGSNTIYFFSERDFYQIDLLDRDFSLIESRDILEREQKFKVISGGNDYCFVKLYPYSNDRFGMYSVVSASGMRIFPYLHYILGGFGVAALAGLSIVLYRFYLRTGYRGRWRG